MGQGWAEGTDRASVNGALGRLLDFLVLRCALGTQHDRMFPVWAPEGRRLMAYAVPDGSSVSELVSAIVSACAGHGVKALWVDVENAPIEAGYFDKGHLTQSGIDKLNALMDALDPHFPIVGFYGNQTTCSHFPNREHWVATLNHTFPGGTWRFCQYDADGGVDHDFFHGTVAQLDAWLDSGASPTPQEDDLTKDQADQLSRVEAFDQGVNDVYRGDQTADFYKAGRAFANDLKSAALGANAQAIADAVVAALPAGADVDTAAVAKAVADEIEKRLAA